jgi:hypothetical protein
MNTCESFRRLYNTASDDRRDILARRKRRGFPHCGNPNPYPNPLSEVRFQGTALHSESRTAGSLPLP